MRKLENHSKSGLTKTLVRSKAASQAQGLKRYFTGLPCKHGHVAERVVADGACCECRRLSVIDWYQREGKAYRKRRKPWSSHRRIGRPPGDKDWRFWSCVERAKGGCWNWTGTRNSSGYGVYFDRLKANYVGAHRRMYELRRGLIPHGMMVCHKCDQPACVKPSHLFLGTAQDNNDDCARKGRTAIGQKNGAHTRPEKVRKGVDHGCSKLTEILVRSLRREHTTGRFTYAELGKRFGCSADNASSIVRRKTWKHLE